ncbi:hypothetical protein DERP_001948 [Dermatophagoides pteronyssinus]|uniref:Uncharacterized protein n=1 Tax=Dermatophagoides pteronyssinus TaxID=6956 RepID=A0ABQ8JBW7_DERPT|nr:hypothetical protein DERP_001948 [Dermatophagoides pteronyssinus]
MYGPIGQSISASNDDCFNARLLNVFNLVIGGLCFRCGRNVSNGISLGVDQNHQTSKQLSYLKVQILDWQPTILS